MRYTSHYNVPVPEDSDPADIPTTVGATADALDAAMYANIAAANAAYAGAATQTYVNQQVQAGAAPLPSVALRMLGNRVSQIVETRADGATDVTTLSYSGDVLTAAVQSNPSKTITFTSSGSTPTGWSIA